MREPTDLSALFADTGEDRENRITERVMRVIGDRTATPRSTLADEILGAWRPAILLAGLTALIMWLAPPGPVSRPAPQSIGVASALGLSIETARLAHQSRAPTLEEVLAVFGQVP
jgi:hypothetical protein